MLPWIGQFKERLVLADILSRSQKLGSGRSLAFVQVDNVMELMFKVYLYHKKELTRKTKKGQILTREQWEQKTKGFNELSNLMKRHSRLKDDLIENIKIFHEIRCELYHSKNALQPTEPQFKDYFKIAVEVLSKLFNEGFGKEKRAAEEARIMSVLGIPTTPQVDRTLEPDQLLDRYIEAKEDGLISVDKDIFDNLADQIRAILYGRAKVGKLKTSSRIICDSLRISFVSVVKMRQVIKRLNHLKSLGHIEKVRTVGIPISETGYRLIEPGIDHLNELIKDK